MSYSVGIGIVTYNREKILLETIDRVRAFTSNRNAALVVADDGSSDGTLAMLHDHQVAVITGANMGIAWNKNRALFLLTQRLDCETVILLEDDTNPEQMGWETAWTTAARRWGQVNFAADWLQQHFLSGAGTPGDPWQSRMVTAQCSAYTKLALVYAGYFDARFKGYGHEHVEHARRLVRAGYGGSDDRIDGQECVLYKLIKGGLRVVTTPSYFDAEQERINLRLAQRLMTEQGCRAPWCDDNQMRQFRLEIENAMSGGSARFRLVPGPPVTVVQQPMTALALQGQTDKPDANGANLGRLFRPA